MKRYTVEIEYCKNVNFREVVDVQAYNISNLAMLVFRNYIGEDGQPAEIIRIIHEEEFYYE